MAGVSQRWLCVALVLLCIAALCLDSAEAGRKNKRGRNKGKPCKYKKAKSDCDPILNTRNLTFTLKKGDEEICPETKVITFSCRKKEGCEYDKRQSEMTECDPHTNKRALTKPLVAGSPDHCPDTHVKVKRCKNGGKFGGKKNKRRKKMKKQRKQRKNKKERKMNKKMRRQERRKMRARSGAPQQ